MGVVFIQVHPDVRIARDLDIYEVQDDGEQMEGP